MSGIDQKNPFFDFFSPKKPNHNDTPENNLKNSKFLSGGRQVEQTYRMLEVAVEQSIDGIAVAGLEGIIRFCNKSWAKMHGYHIYELLGRHLSIFHTQEQMEKIVVPFNEQVKKKGAYQGEVGHVKKNGKVFSTWMTTTLLKDARGKPIGFLGIARNITREKRLHDMVVASEKKYRTLFENAITGIGISQGNRVITANKALLDIFGYDNEDEFTKIPLLYHVALESRDFIRERMRKRQKDEQVTLKFEYKIIRKDGMIRDVEASSSEIIIDNEKYLLTVFRDITEQKKTHLLLEAYLKEWQTAFNSTKEQLFLLDKQFIILRANEACAQFINKPLNLIVGKKCYEVFHGTNTPPDDCLLKKVINTKRHEEQEVFLADRDVWLQITVNPILDEKGNLVGAVHVAKDVTEIKKTTQRISKINDCFVGFGTDPDKNINSLVSLCGEVMGATCALYSRLNKDILCSIALWQVPADFNPINKPEGLICYDVIKRGKEGFFIVRNLDKTQYAQTDPYVLKYGLKTYIGLPINFGNNTIGSLCVVYQKDFIPSQEDKRFMQIIASAIAVEEERRYADKEVEKSKAEYRALAENINVGIYRVTGGREGELIEGKFIQANSAMVKMFGYESKEEFFSVRLSNLYQDLAAVERVIKKVLKYGSIKNDELFLKRKDGTVFTASVSAVAVRDEKGRVGYIDGIIEDKTLRKKAEEEILSISKFPSEDPNPVLRIDSKGSVIYKNEATNRLLRELNLSEKDIFNILPYNLLEALEKILRTNEVLHAQEARIGDRIFSYTIVPIKDTGYVNLYGVDITRNKKSEETLERREYFLNNVFDSIKDGISVSDKEMRIVRVNSVMEEWYKYVLPLVGKKCYEAYHGRNKPCEVCPTIKTLQTGEPAYEVVPWRDKQRKIIGWFDLYSFPLVDTKTNEITGVIEYVRDITQRKLAEEESKKLNEELLRTNKRLKQLALRDSHTGLYNHRYLEDAIDSEFCRAERYAQPLSVVMLDIDYFKSINDAYSHQFGDMVLKQFARQLKRMVRKYDIVVRFGGEEFIIISPGTDKHTTLNFTQRILNRLNVFSFGDESQNVKLKLSLAVASYPEDNVARGIDLVSLAERILNKAKEDGGNRAYSLSDITYKKPLEKDRERPDVTFLKVKIDKLNKQANQSLVESVFAFARTIKLKDNYTGEHVESTVYYATEVARKLNLSKEETEHVRRASMVHDLGKIGISENILLKKGKLTKREFSVIKRHPQIGADILRPIHFLNNIIPLIHYHHERWDGKGYPYGLKKEQIPLGARIVAIADVYQALISDRPYRKAYSKSRAQELIQAGSGSQFDPQVVDAFLKIQHH